MAAKRVDFAPTVQTRLYALGYVDGVVPSSGCGVGFVGHDFEECTEPLTGESRPGPSLSEVDKAARIYGDEPPTAEDTQHLADLLASADQARAHRNETLALPDDWTRLRQVRGTKSVGLPR
ncbi:hypothetical protein ACHHYP_09023 [Achlya hypogyna]|uniref:Uncharacterized protein n=1 Tax=Achlya hypogyna TaxID=1202772 RepID=A0A1V9ZJI6_ACHHY|nr:hypothetical protein ACHHYP_09023 [Achlya hypogyna]